MSKIEEFDTNSLAWITYKIFYGIDLNINEKGRKHIELALDNKVINMSGDTDFNFGPGWSHTIFSKYKNYLKKVTEDYQRLYIEQLNKCQKLYKSVLNISLMPQTGNLQSTKKGIGNDRIDTYIWALNSYYTGENTLLFNNATFNNTDYLKEYLALFNNNIYNYCSKIYGINESLVQSLIESGKMAIDSPERVIYYMTLAYRFWCQKLKYIRMRMDENKNILSSNEKKLMERELQIAENILNNWYE